MQAPTSILARPSTVRLAAGLLAIAAAAGTGWYVNDRLTATVLEQATFRAADQVQLAVLDGGSAADLAEPYTDAKLSDLAARMGPAVSQVQKAQSGLIRVNVIGRDGMVLYSDAPGNRGHVVPGTKEPFAEALKGQTGRDESSLSTPENEDLKDHYGRALEVYVPIFMDGAVAGVYEIYEDVGPLGTVRLLVWGVIALSLCLILAVLARRPNEASPREQPLLARGSSNVGLTARELDVLRLMRTCHSYRDIADQLVISEETVRSHVKSILRKLGQPDSTRALLAAVKAGILELP